MRLKDKVAIVTGGGQGIGREYCLRFAQEGAAVALGDLRFGRAKEVEAEIRRGEGRALAITLDVAEETSVRTMVDRVLAEFGRIDILLNNAAIYYDLDIRDHSNPYLRKVLEVNIIGVLNMSRAVFPHMKRAKSGSIINIASVGAYPTQEMHQPGENFPSYAYGLSKAGVIYLTQAMARTAGYDNVRVNAIAPGTTLTEATKRVLPERVIERRNKLKALGRALQPSDLVGTAVYLASDDSAMMTGQTLVVDGGGTMLG